ncbi:MAG: class I SAM-dependent methyltransferase [Candidatus Omnitrophica bacterium]|nr:class I SAM-dependent methyltransferase [Candidatus Omnitrophota bacterium]
MKDRMREKFPSSVPLPHRLALQARKLYRQTAVRIQEARAARQKPNPLHEDGEAATPVIEAVPPLNPHGAINKCARWVEEDLQRPEIKAVVDRLGALERELSRRGLRFTNTAGNFLPRQYHPELITNKRWENAWLIGQSRVAPGHRVLDVGGASTIFSFYLASLGCRVAVVDNDWANCGTIYNARYVARKMGWALEALDRDIQYPLPFADNAFDRVFSVCVFEHLSSPVRQTAIREMGRVLAPGGIAGLTCDYDAWRPVRLTDKGLRFAYRAKLERDVIRPSGLDIYGNTDWVDAYPNEEFLGAFFLQKTHAGASRSSRPEGARSQAVSAAS